MGQEYCCEEGAFYLNQFKNNDYEFKFCPYCGESLEEQKKGLRITFDFDGVFTPTGYPYADKSAYDFAIRHAQQVAKDGHHITIATARYMGKCKGDAGAAHNRGYREACDWLMQHGVPFNKLVFGKPSADIYVDDRGVHVDSSKGELHWQNNFWPRVRKLQQERG